MAIKNVFLDLDDTLFDFRRAERGAISATLSEYGIEPTDSVAARYSEINKECWRALEEGKMTRDRVLTHRFERLFAELSASADPALVRKNYEANLARGHYFMPGAKELIEELFGKYKLYITTNGTERVQVGRIGSSGIEKYFCDIFISERLGADKPSPIFFDKCFERMENAKREETIIVGDSLTSDILGGIGAGIHTCRFNPRGEAGSADIVPEYEISALSELAELLEKIN